MCRLRAAVDGSPRAKTTDRTEPEAKLPAKCDLFDGCDPRDPFLNDKLLFNSKIGHPPHTRAVQTGLVDNTVNGTFEIPGVGTADVDIVTYGPGDFVGRLSLGGTPFFDISMSPTVPEWNYTHQNFAALGLSDDLNERAALASAEIWNELALRHPDAGLTVGGGVDAECEIETTACPPDCKSILFGSRCILCLKVKCKAKMKGG
jgi:hypothetical protein